MALINQQTAEELVDYEEDEQQIDGVIKEKHNDENIGRGNYVAIHASGFRDFFLKPELLRAIGDAGFEHPSEVQHETIPHAITGADILCQAKSGMGKTAVFVLSILQQLNIDNSVNGITNNNIINRNEINGSKNDGTDGINRIKNDINNDGSNNNAGNNSNSITNNLSSINNNDDKEILKSGNNNMSGTGKKISNNSSFKSNNNNIISGDDAADGKMDTNIVCLVLAHTRELAFQIKNEFERFSKYMKGVKTEVVYGGISVQKNVAMLSDPKTCPNILIGTPGRVLALIKMRCLNLSKIAHFVLDECDRCLEKMDMRKDVQEIFISTMKKKQVMFFSATMNKEIRNLCRKFMQQQIEIFIDDESKLTLHGLLQYYVKLQESEKNKKLNDLLDMLEFNQVIIFVKSVNRAQALDALLRECSFPSFAIHGSLKQEERINRYQQFKNFEKRIMVATDLFGRGIDIERVNIVINYDMPDTTDAYLHRVGRAGRFGTKGLAITFVASQEDTSALNEVQTRFEVDIPEMPAAVDASQYINQ